MIQAFRKLLRWLLLRGPGFNWWVAQRARQWERAYCAELMRSNGAPDKQNPTPRVSSSAKLRTIVFIADCMWEQRDLVPELRKIAEVVVLDLGPKLRARPAAHSQSGTVADTVKAFTEEQKDSAPDVILFYARPALLSEEVFHCLRQRWNCPLFGMNLDDKFEFFPYGIFSGSVDNYQRWAREFDLNLTSCLSASAWYHERGLPCFYSPQGVHQPKDLSPPASAAFQYSFSFVGSRKPERTAIIGRILEAGIPIQLFGSKWPNSQWVEDVNAVYRNTQINLGIGFPTPSTTLTTIKNRDFECPGVGACYLTTYNWELAGFYELGKEILCYRSVEELIEMYSYYRKRPQECLRIAQAAWQRCSNEHTWEKRFRKIFQKADFRI